MHSRARIVFAGTPEFAVPSLRALLNSPHEVIAVLTQPDRPAGRGRKTAVGPVKLAALDADVVVMQPATLRDSSVQQTLRDLQLDLLVVVAYGQLLPPDVLSIPRIACLNVHASLLPRWRGASPIQTAVLSGDKETGITLMQMEAGLDTGPVYCAQRTAIGMHETAGQLHDRLAIMGGELLAANLDAILERELKPAPQSLAGITYAGRISKADGLIDWMQSAIHIDRQIRAFNPWPVAHTHHEGELLRCWSAIPLGDCSRDGIAAGAVVSVEPRGMVVKTGAGLLLLTEVQAPGKNRVSAAEYANARNMNGKVLGQ